MQDTLSLTELYVGNITGGSATYVVHQQHMLYSIWLTSDWPSLLFTMHCSAW
jgi:hypothetical protein